MQKTNLPKLIGIVIGLSMILACSAAALTDKIQTSPFLPFPDTIGNSIVKDNIQKFTGSQNEAVTYRGTKEFPLGKMYEVTTNSGDRYYINANNGEIEVAMIRNAASTKSISGTDIASIRDPVKKFVETNYRNFTNKQMKLDESKVIDHGDAGKEYVFYWNAMSGEAYTLSSVMVSVYPDMENAITYVAFDRPLLVDTMPKVSQDEAEKSALHTFEMGAAAKTMSKLLVVPDGSNQKLVWLVDTVEQDEEGFTHGGIATVDAVTGEVISTSPSQ
ncbi:MAG: hypothetical protein Q7J03_05670 [Methanoregula sp.]|nr:hypothetical protein [Methanoregula sp.]